MMSPRTHTIYLWSLVTASLATLIFLIIRGYSFYQVEVIDRFYHPDYSLLKPSGTLGHGYGIIGALMIIIGIGVYMLRKRLRYFSRWGVLKHWLEFHIFLCTVGAILIVFHTSFKFGGIVAVSFWSMVAVVLSGVVGRYIYLQIPHSIEGRSLSLKEVVALKDEFKRTLIHDYGIDELRFNAVKDQRKEAVRFIRKELALRKLSRREIRKALSIYRLEHKLGQRIKRLEQMQNLFRYWHVAHLPFALIMLIIMFIHIAIALLFGYKWIF